MHQRCQADEGGACLGRADIEDTVFDKPTHLYGNLRSSSEASTLSKEADCPMFALWSLLAVVTLSGVLLFMRNELAGVEVYTKTQVLS